MRAYYCGVISRSDLASAFGMSDAAATKDLKLYNDLTNNNLIYQQSQFGFVPSLGFSPYFTDLSPVRALQMFALNLNSIEGPYQDESIFQIEAEVIPTALRLPRMEILAAITRAIYAHKKLKVSYYSLSDKDNENIRTIEPHTLVNTGNRWHVRAYSCDTFDFRDYVLSRFSLSELTNEAAESNSEYDDDWCEFLNVKIIPHPRLSPERQDVLLMDYGAKEGYIEILTRRALIAYVLQTVGIDTSADASGSPQRFPFVIQNRDEIEPYAGWIFD